LGHNIETDEDPQLELELELVFDQSINQYSFKERHVKTQANTMQ